MSLEGMGCQAGGDKPCGMPATFMYYGFHPDPKRWGRKAERIKLLMCSDHAIQYIRAEAWETTGRDPRAPFMQRLGEPVFRMHCKNQDCGVFMKLQWDTQAPGLNPGSFVFCPRCGERNAAIVDAEADYWDLVSEAFDGMPVQLLKMLYDEWTQSPGKYARFGPYVRAQIEAFDDTQEMLDVL